MAARSSSSYDPRMLTQPVVSPESKMIGKTLCIFAIAVISMSLQARWTYAQQARGAVQAPPVPQLLFKMTLQNETRLPLTQSSITTDNVDLQLYGDGKNIIVAVGNGANLPRTFFGLCRNPCGFTLRDR